MDKNGLLLVFLLLFMIAFGRSNGFKSRKLVMAPDPNGNSNANQDPPLSSPPPKEGKQNPFPAGTSELKDTQTTNLTDVNSKGLNDANTTKGSENSSDKNLHKKRSQDGKEKVENHIQSKTSGSISCKGNPICSDQKKTLIACIQDIENGSSKLTLAMQNEQDIGLNVTIIVGTSTTNLSVSAHQTEKLNITFSKETTNKIILNAGNGDCELQINETNTIMSMNNTSPSNPKPKDSNDPANPKDVKIRADSPVKPVEGDDPSKSKTVDSPSKGKEANTPAKPNSPGKSTDIVNDQKVNDPLKPSVNVENNFLDQLSLYSKQVTPMYGAYLGFLVALVIGASWAMCSFRKRRSNGGVAYQELEMGIPESSQVETTEGWDADWGDDDWDGENAIRPPGISSNGLTSRGVKKDGWDADWDD